LDSLPNFCSHADVLGPLVELYFTGANEILSSNNKKAIIINVPYRLHRRFQKIQYRLIRELEKIFDGTHVFLVAQRTVKKTNTPPSTTPPTTSASATPTPPTDPSATPSPLTDVGKVKNSTPSPPLSPIHRMIHDTFVADSMSPEKKARYRPSSETTEAEL
jgi:hypothetical protein